VETWRPPAQDGVHDRFVEAVAERVARIRVDQGLQEESVVGPLINQAALDKLAALVEDAKQAGARVVLGGKPHAKGSLFYEPTSLSDLNDQITVANTEIVKYVLMRAVASGQRATARNADSIRQQRLEVRPIPPKQKVNAAFHKVDWRHGGMALSSSNRRPIHGDEHARRQLDGTEGP